MSELTGPSSIEGCPLWFRPWSCSKQIARCICMVSMSKGKPELTDSIIFHSFLFEQVCIHVNVARLGNLPLSLSAWRWYYLTGKWLVRGTSVLFTTTVLLSMIHMENVTLLILTGFLCLYYRQDIANTFPAVHGFPPRHISCQGFSYKLSSKVPHQWDVMINVSRDLQCTSL